MFHLDNNSGVSSMPAVSAMQDSSPRWFTEGGGNKSPSWPGQDWFNIIQAELLNVLADAGVAPDKTKFNQLSLAIKSIIDNKALLIDNSLSEIKKAGASAQKQARDNIGVGNSSELDVGTTAGTVAAGDDSRITNAVQRTGDVMTGDLTLQNLYIDGDGYIEKRKIFVGDDGTNSTNGLRIRGRADMYADIYHYEQPGTHHSLSIHVAGGGGDGWFAFWQNGEFHFGSGILAADGNLYGPMWGGWLNNWLTNQLAARDTNIRNLNDYVNASFVVDVRLAGYGELYVGSNVNAEVPAGCVVIGAIVNGTWDNNEVLKYASLQKYVNGTWYTVGRA